MLSERDTQVITGVFVFVAVLAYIFGEVRKLIDPLAKQKTKTLEEREADVFKLQSQMIADQQKMITMLLEVVDASKTMPEKSAVDEQQAS